MLWLKEKVFINHLVPWTCLRASTFASGPLKLYLFWVPAEQETPPYCQFWVRWIGPTRARCTSMAPVFINFLKSSWPVFAISTSDLSFSSINCCLSFRHWRIACYRHLLGGKCVRRRSKRPKSSWAF